MFSVVSDCQSVQRVEGGPVQKCSCKNPPPPLPLAHLPAPALPSEPVQICSLVDPLGRQPRQPPRPVHYAADTSIGKRAVGYRRKVLLIV